VHEPVEASEPASDAERESAVETPQREPVHAEKGAAAPASDSDPALEGTPEPEDVELDAGMVEYVQLTTSLIEGREVSREEILEMLRRAVRQHSIGSERRLDYILRVLKKEPPP
jgi:hypothetical protein